MLLSYGDGLACSPTKWLQQLHIPMITIIVTTLTIFLSVLVNTDLDQEQKLDIKGLTDWLTGKSRGAESEHLGHRTTLITNVRGKRRDSICSWDVCHVLEGISDGTVLYSLCNSSAKICPFSAIRLTHLWWWL